MAGIALKYGATLDKYVGDAIIAFFGDPETRGVAEDAKACVAMAVEMQLPSASRRTREPVARGPGATGSKVVITVYRMLACSALSGSVPG